MEPDFHTMESLFKQLGLPSAPGDINGFIGRHVLAHDTPLSQANFWTEAQSRFLQDCLDEDADWAEVVDHLDARLRC